MNGPSVTIEDVLNSVEGETYSVLPNGRTTVCQLTLLGGRFTVEGQSACVDPANFDPVKGNKYAREDAVRKIWPLLGFSLAQKLHLLDQAPPLGGTIIRLGEVKTYLGTKVVFAIPMTRLGYNALRGWKLPDDEDGNDPGFLVQYTEGGAPNVEGFSGYISWSPRDIFEAAYKTSMDPVVNTWLDRLIKEASDLEEKCTKLAAFLDQDPPVVVMTKEDREDLEEQYGWMKQYLLVLRRRIARAQAK